MGGARAKVQRLAAVPLPPAVLVLVLATTVVQAQGEQQRLPTVQPIPERSSEVGDGDLEVLSEYKSTSIGGVEGVQEYIHCDATSVTCSCLKRSPFLAECSVVWSAVFG